jgi:hypothetical protein
MRPRAKLSADGRAGDGGAEHRETGRQHGTAERGAGSGKS